MVIIKIIVIFKNIDSYRNIISDYGTIINCVANTDTYSDNRLEHWDVNYKFVSDLVDVCNDKK